MGGGGGGGGFCHFHVFLSITSLIKTPGLSNFLPLDFTNFTSSVQVLGPYVATNWSNSDFVRTTQVIF